MKTVIVQPTAWRAVWEERARTAPPGRAALAWASLRACQSSGRAAPFSICFDFAACFGERGEPIEPWRGFRRALVDGLASGGLTEADRRIVESEVDQLFGYWRDDPWRAVEAVLAPLVEAVQEDLGEAWFFAGEGFDAPKDFRVAYGAYETKFEKRLAQLLTDKSESGKLWRTATFYCGLRMRDRPAEDDAYRLDPLATRLHLSGVAPEDRREAARRVSSRPVRDSRNRAGSRPQQAGVDGVRRTRSLEDLPAVLPSELAQPPILFLDKLLNEGVAALDRPPPTREDRTATIGCVALEGDLGSAASVAEAAWWLAFETVALRLFSADFAHVVGAYLELPIDHEEPRLVALALSRELDNYRSRGDEQSRRLDFLRRFPEGGAPFERLRRPAQAGSLNAWREVSPEEIARRAEASLCDLGHSVEPPDAFEQADAAHLMVLSALDSGEAIESVESLERRRKLARALERRFGGAMTGVSTAVAGETADGVAFVLSAGRQSATREEIRRPRDWVGLRQACGGLAKSWAAHALEGLSHA